MNLKQAYFYPVEKIYFSNWENILSQLGKRYFSISR
nr:MAG TPA: hypothetical protein [Crassvirales sp.]